MWFEAKTFNFSAQIINSLRVNLIFDSLTVLDEEVLRLLIATACDHLGHGVDAWLEAEALELLLVLLRFSALNEDLLLEFTAHTSRVQLLTVVQVVLLSPLRVDDL